MTLWRKTIRCRVRDALRGKTRAGTRVSSSRYEPIIPEADGTEAEFVSLSVYTLSDRPERHTNSPRIYLPRLEVAVEVFAQQGPASDDTALDDLVDEVSDQVECLVEPLIPQLEGLEIPGREPLGINPDLSGLDRVELEFDAAGVQLSGVARLVFVVAYETSVDERDEAELRDFERARVRYKFPPVDPDAPADAEDDIDPVGE